MSIEPLKTHYSVYEIAAFKLNSAPRAAKNVQEKAKREGWLCRKRSGRGGGLEYAFDGLPQEIQAEILLKVNQPASGLAVADKTQLAKAQVAVSWAEWETATLKSQAAAMLKHSTVCSVADLVEHGIKLLEAIEMVVGKINRESDGKTVSIGSVKRWYYHVKGADRALWLPMLLGDYGETHGRNAADFSAEAWAFFKADYLRIEKPQFGSCYERLKRAAPANGWLIPSASSVKRKIERDIPYAQRIYLREGDYAVSRLFPSMIRSVDNIAVMEWINGDGYQHNVWVRWHNGKVCRPKTWLWQDVRTRMIVGYRCDETENTDMIRLALLGVIYKYGLPQKITIDNTRAAANKQMTGGVKNRYRFKVQEDEVQGIIPALGIQLHWTSIKFGRGRGQAKPVERAFSHGGLGQLVDLHPTLAGFHTGPNAYSKPDYEIAPSGGVDYETFILALEDGIQTFNERLERDTEMCQGTLSYQQAFERDLPLTTLRYATPEQMRFLVTLHEEVSLDKNGTFCLKAGGKPDGLRNRYEAYALIGTVHKRVVVRFDPADLHNTVWVYSRDGKFLAEAQCTQKVAFGDSQSGRAHSRKEAEFVRHIKKAAKAQQEMDIQKAARYMPEVEIDDEPAEPKMVEMVRAHGNTLRKEAVLLDDEPEDIGEQLFNKGLEILKREKGL